MKVGLILNSDFGVSNTIGARAYPIAKELNNVSVFGRDIRRDLAPKYAFRKVVPFGKLVMQALTAIPIYVSRSINTNPLKVKIFETFLRKKLSEGFDVLHFWDPLPNVYAYIKKNFPNTKIVLDTPMALPNMIENIKDYDVLFKNESCKIPQYFLDSVQYVDHFIVPSSFVHESLHKVGIKDKKISIVPFGVDKDAFTSRKHSLDRKVIRFAFSGNVNNRKGITYLLQAFSSLNLKHAQLHIYGRVYPEAKHILKGKNVFVHGFVDMKKELGKNDVYVFPSLLEGSAKSVYEAMVCSMPIITTYNAGSIVRDRKDGFIIPIQDAEILKKKMLFFYEHRDQLRKMGKSAKKYAQTYSWERYAKEVTKAYEKLL